MKNDKKGAIRKLIIEILIFGSIASAIGGVAAGVILNRLKDLDKHGTISTIVSTTTIVNPSVPKNTAESSPEIRASPSTTSILEKPKTEPDVTSIGTPQAGITLHPKQSGDILLDMQQTCGEKFTIFDQEFLKRAIKGELSKYNFHINNNVRVTLVAGYRLEPFDRDIGTTIRAYAVFGLCAETAGAGHCKEQKADCNNLRVFGAEASREANKRDAMEKLASSIAYLIRNPKQLKGSL